MTLFAEKHQDCPTCTCTRSLGQGVKRADLFTDKELKELWGAAGGSFHGPNVETGVMPEAKLLPFLRRLSTPEHAAEAIHSLLEKINLLEGVTPVAIAGSMPGTSGFTMATFEATKVPVGTKLYTAPPDADKERLREALELAIRQNSHDMVMTGDEMRLCEAALKETK